MIKTAINKSKFFNASEVDKFTKLANQWWNPYGKMKPLHRFNPTRVDYIAKQICTDKGLNFEKDKPLSGISVLDVGCAGGILSESLTLLGAKVVGIDASCELIKVAKLHAKSEGLKINYLHKNVEDMAKLSQKFDAVMALEIVEHVRAPKDFLKEAAKCVKQDGTIFVSTINRTLKSYALAILGAEYILKWLPKNTHDWHKFLKPSEVCKMLGEDNFKPHNMTGITYSLFEDVWIESKNDLEVNYIINFKKQL